VTPASAYFESGARSLRKSRPLITTGDLIAITAEACTGHEC
jgi:hypothetical protein